MTCAICQQPIVGSLQPRKYHRPCREKARGKRAYALKIERRIEAILRAQRRLRRAA